MGNGERKEPSPSEPPKLGEVGGGLHRHSSVLSRKKKLETLANRLDSTVVAHVTLRA